MKSSTLNMWQQHKVAVAVAILGGVIGAQANATNFLINVDPQTGAATHSVVIAPQRSTDTSPGTNSTDIYPAQQINFLPQDNQAGSSLSNIFSDPILSQALAGAAPEVVDSFIRSLTNISDENNLQISAAERIDRQKIAFEELVKASNLTPEQSQYILTRLSQFASANISGAAIREPSSPAQQGDRQAEILALKERKEQEAVRARANANAQRLNDAQAPIDPSSANESPEPAANSAMGDGVAAAATPTAQTPSQSSNGLNSPPDAQGFRDSSPVAQAAQQILQELPRQGDVFDGARPPVIDAAAILSQAQSRQGAATPLQLLGNPDRENAPSTLGQNSAMANSGVSDATSGHSRQDFAITLARALRLDNSPLPLSASWNDVPAGSSRPGWVNAALEQIASGQFTDIPSANSQRMDSLSPEDFGNLVANFFNNQPSNALASGPLTNTSSANPQVLLPQLSTLDESGQQTSGLKSTDPNGGLQIGTFEDPNPPEPYAPIQALQHPDAAPAPVPSSGGAPNGRGQSSEQMALEQLRRLLGREPDAATIANYLQLIRRAASLSAQELMSQVNPGSGNQVPTDRTPLILMLPNTPDASQLQDMDNLLANTLGSTGGAFQPLPLATILAGMPNQPGGIDMQQLHLNQQIQSPGFQAIVGGEAPSRPIEEGCQAGCT